MVKRKGLGKGRGMGYKNLIPIKDSRVHSQSSRGIKQKQKLNSIIRQTEIIDGKFGQLWKLRGKIPEDELEKKFKKLRESKQKKQLWDKIRKYRENPDKELSFDYGEYGVVLETYRHPEKENAKIIEVSPDEYFRLVPEVSEGEPTLFIPRILAIRKYIKKTGKIAVPFIEVKDNKVTSQEGRHTMFVARMFGVKKVPLLVLGKFDNINTIEPEYQ